MRLFTFLATAVFLSGCHRPVNTADPVELRAAAEVVLLPHLVQERREDVKSIIRNSTLPESIKRAALSDTDKEELRAGKIVLSQVGAKEDDIKKRVKSLKDLLLGITERPMSRGELEAIGPWVDARMIWAAVDGNLLLGRDDREVGQLTAGLNLSKSPGLTRYGAEMVRDMGIPVLEAWENTPVDLYSGEVRYIAGLFGAREGVEASVVIFSVLVALGLAKSGRPIGKRIFAGAACAIFLAVATGFAWKLLIGSGWLGSDGQSIFIVFGVLSILMFLLIGSAIFHPIYFGRWIGTLRDMGRKNASGAAFWVAFAAVYREGFEMSLSMTTLSMIGGWNAVFQGLGVGIPAGLLMVAAGWKIHSGFLGLRGMLIASGGMMVFAAASFAALFMNFLEQQGTVDPVYLFSNVPTAVTVLTGLSGSFQTLAMFVGTAGLLLAPWMIRRSKKLFYGGGGAGSALREALAAVAVAGAISVLLALSINTRREGAQWSGEVASWSTASDDSKTGLGVLVDTRVPGSSPPVEGTTGLPPDNDDNSIRQFCEFAAGKKIYVFGEEGTAGSMAKRIADICGQNVALIKGGPWERN